LIFHKTSDVNEYSLSYSNMYSTPKTLNCGSPTGVVVDRLQVGAVIN